MSLNDIKSEGTYIWESTQKNLYPWGGGIGYANWDPMEPNNLNDEEDCVVFNRRLIGMVGTGWNDFSCINTFDAICESQP